MWCHVLNRGNRREVVFHKPADYDAFVKAMADAQARLPVDILGYCLMPNHFHLVIRTHADGDMGRWVQWLLMAHARRYHRHYRTTGHVWQGRFKAFPVQDGDQVRQNDQLLGTCGFNEWSQAHRWAELAYDLAQAHWGKGLMRQAVAVVLQWTFRQDQVDRVHAFVRVDNKRSERLLERSGFVREGCLRSYRVCGGEPHDFHVYSLLRSDRAAAQPLS